QTGRNGCFSTEVLPASFNLAGFHPDSQLHAYASLLEEGTGMRRTATKNCTVVNETVTITFKNTDGLYQHGIPYTGMVLLKGTDGSALKEKEFLLVVNTGGKVERRTLRTDRLGRASFMLSTAGWTGQVSLHAELKKDPAASEREGKEYPDYQSVTRYLFPLHSDSNFFLKIRSVEKKLPCSQPQNLWVDYVFDEKAMGIKLQSLDMVFLVLAKGTIANVLRKKLPAEAGPRGSFSLELPIGPELAPTAKVLGYVMLPDSEMVADSTELQVAKCFPNKVNLSFSEQRALVGSQLCLKVQAAPGSLCAVYAVDRHTLSSGPKGKLNPSAVYKLLPMSSEDSYLFEVAEPEFDHCLLVALPSINCFDLPKESWSACQHSLQRRDAPPPCWLWKDWWGHPVSFHPSWKHVQVAPLFAGAELEDEPAGVTHGTGMQTDFLGTWLWELVPVGEGGSAEVTVTVPNAITQWEAGMFCTSPLGLGLAPATTLTAFKPFFVELALPYTVVRHEAFTLVATVINNLRQCLQVQVTLVESAELEVLAGRDGAYRGCVCADEERTFEWSLRATRLGEVNVTVTAKALRSAKLCGTKVPVGPAQGHVDTKTKLLAVQVSLYHRIPS
ncbi:A2ML1 protein, partial [Psophia crepitans]|nr:A2ML1 protein [Psophia crepitans]